MKKLLLILFFLPIVVCASFPVLASFNDPDEVGGIISGILGFGGALLGIYYLYRLYKNSFNPWLRFLGIFGIIVISIFMLLAIMLIVEGV